MKPFFDKEPVDPKSYAELNNLIETARKNGAKEIKIVLNKDTAIGLQSKLPDIPISLGAENKGTIAVTVKFEPK